ncbi:hypothetical protein [Planctellipticum variicoloris]|uniref:hypothetical protein n=1 Tax=Planctellipticum variicoloris TaxID=3064265 RepID=UPI003013EA42|nr:hypothetical protein SH412_005049 [Planctomycetaceae bacterium SH412]
MAVRDDDSDGGSFGDDAGWWSGDERSLDQLLEFVGPGSRLVYEYEPTARVGGVVNFLDLAPVVGVTRYAERHEILTGVHFSSRGKKCLLDFAELTGLVKFLEAWIRRCCREVGDDRPRVKQMRYETRNGLVIESATWVWGGVASVYVASPVMTSLSGAQLEQLLRELQRVQAFLEEFRG